MQYQYLVNALASGSLYAIMAIGFGLIYRTTKIFHIAHGAVITLGGYILFMLTVQHRVPIIPSLLGTVLISSIMGILLFFISYFPLLQGKASQSVMMISSIAIYSIIVNTTAMAFGNETQFIRGGADITFSVKSTYVTRLQLINIIVCVLVIAMFLVLLYRTSLGNSIRAVSDDSELATSMGINLNYVYIFVFGIGSALAGLAGALISLDRGIDPQAGFMAVLVACVAVIVGGVTSFKGAVFGAFMVSILQNLVTWVAGVKWQPAATFLLLIVFLLFRPEGVFSQQQRTEER